LQKDNKLGSAGVPDTFESLYAPLNKEVFTEQALQQMERGADAFAAARS